MRTRLRAALVDDPPVGQHGRTRLVERVVAKLEEVASVGVDPEDVALHMPVAPAELDVARGREDDASVGQVGRVDVGVGAIRDLPQPAAVDVHLIDGEVGSRTVMVGRILLPRNVEDRRQGLRQSGGAHANKGNS